MLTIPLLDLDTNYKKRLSNIISKNEKVKIIIYGVNPFWELLINSNKNIEFILYIIDLEPLTSCCHHHYECIKFDSDPKKCYGANFLGQRLINFYSSKKTNLINKNISKIFLENKYSLDLIKKTNLIKSVKKTSVIGLSTRTCPLNKSEAKNELKSFDLNVIENTLIMCSASNCLNERKNIKAAVSGFKNINKEYKNCNLLVIGKNSNFFEDRNNNIFSIDNLLIEDYLLMIKATDIYLSTSISDLGPTTVNQAYSSGCYICATKTGSPLELIKEGINGFLIEENCIDLNFKLAKTIDLFLNSGPLKEDKYDDYNIKKVCTNFLKNLK